MLSANNEDKFSSAGITEYFKSVCSRAGLKTTRQRLRIYLELLKAGDHPTAEILHSRLRPEMPKLSLDTVYRALATFEREGMIRRVSTFKSQARYDADMKPHHHFVCKTCGAVIDFDWPSFDMKALPEEVSGLGSVSDRTVTASGVCRRCLVKKD